MIRREDRRAEREKEESKVARSPTLVAATDLKPEDPSDEEPSMDYSDDEGVNKSKLESETPVTPADPLVNGYEGLKRKRDSEDGRNSLDAAEEGATPTKRQKSETPPPPPPPPPPPAAELPTGTDQISEQAEMDSAMEVDAVGGFDLTDMANGCGLIHGQDPDGRSSTMLERPPPPPPPVDDMRAEALDTPVDGTENLTLDSPDINRLSAELGVESERDGGFASKHFQGVRGVEVHQGS